MWDGRYVKIRKQGLIIYPHLYFSQIICLLSHTTDNQVFLHLKKQGLEVKILGQRLRAIFLSGSGRFRSAEITFPPESVVPRIETEIYGKELVQG